MNKNFLTGQQALQGSASNGNVLPDQTKNGQNLFTNFKTKFMNKNVFFVAMMLFASMFFLTGCNHDDSSDIKVTDPQVLKEMKWMRDKGIWTEEDYQKHLHEGDMPVYYGDKEMYLPSCESKGVNACDQAAPREFIQKMMKEDEQQMNFSARHRRTQYMYTSNGGTITVRIGKSVPTAWKTAISSAITEWNALGYKVKFAGLSSTNDTNVSGYINVDYIDTQWGTKNLATTDWISSVGGFSYAIHVNTKYYDDPNNLLTTSARKVAMAHELGHAIGIAHTDATLSASNNVYDTNQFKCNGLTDYADPSSMFKAITLPNAPWLGFTTCDKALVDYYWGKIA